MFTPDIKGGMEMKPGDWFIETSDEKMRLQFKTKEEMEKAKDFMSRVADLARQSGHRIASNNMSEAREALREHIEQCEEILIRLNT